MLRLFLLICLGLTACQTSSDERYRNARSRPPIQSAIESHDEYLIPGEL